MKILFFIIGFIFGAAVEYYGIRDDIKKAQNMDELKIKYGVR